MSPEKVKWNISVQFTVTNINLFFKPLNMFYHVPPCPSAKPHYEPGFDPEVMTMGSPKHANLPTSPPMLHFIRLLQCVLLSIQASPAIQFQSDWKGPQGNGCHCPNFMFIHLLLCSDEIGSNVFGEHRWMKGKMTIVPKKNKFHPISNI